MKNLLKVVVMLAVILPSQAWAEKTLGEQCNDRGGTWLGSPAGSLDTGVCILKLVANPNVGTPAKCKMAGGTASGDSCKLPAASFVKLPKQSTR